MYGIFTSLEESFKLNTKSFIDFYTNDSLVRTITEKIKSGSNRIQLKGLNGSLDAVIAAACYLNDFNDFLFILTDREEAVYFQNDLQCIFPDKEILLFPGSYKRPYEFQDIENANILMRAEILNRINHKEKTGKLIVSYPDALTEKVINKRSLLTHTYLFRKDEEISTESLAELLYNYDFERSDFVYEAGQFSMRGGIIDIYSYANEFPFRIELAGNTIESIRTFNPESQLSVHELNEIQIIPNVQTRLINESRDSFFTFLNENTRIWLKDYNLSVETIEKYYSKAVTGFSALTDKAGEKQVILTPDQLFETPDSFERALDAFCIIEFGSRFHFRKSESLVFFSNSQPSFNKNYKLLADNLDELQHKEYKNFICSESENQIERLHSIFKEINPFLFYHTLPVAFRSGFIDHTLKITLYTDHQIFDRYHRSKGKQLFTKSKALTLRELKTLQPGDYITHIDYGIGRFVGLDRIEVNGRMQEALRLIYKDDDLLYVGIQSLHKISKYTGKEGRPPVMSKLGSGDWELKKRSVKKKVKDIAADLIKLYAKRRNAPGYIFKPDAFLQAELESSFIYEDTPDQASATLDVKKDMEKAYPMDRLICGDVGFGKTEIAIRAAFLSVCNNKQVAILVPTTILAFQHYRTLTERLSGFPVNIEYISRFKSATAIKRTIENLENGKIDIIIGTHRLVNKDIKFRDLGLLIIDEEQKFGVSLKEKLKELKVNVDTLTLTATPIPRTLQFSLLGARDLSIIATAPPNRQPVTTEIHTFNEALIRDAISAEIRREGQVFFVHNRISDIVEIANIIIRLVPDSRIGIAHGQMKGDALESIMLKFIEGEYDVLVSTNIIESGLDIPNANTIIINRAHMFGLSDLHQMRGRVGRSNKKAYCYLLTSTMSTMTAEARKRLIALEEFSELGDGFKVAMRDLDIRGAGNLLGAEQSGFVNDLGFETYHKVLDEAVEELKNNEFRDLFEQDYKKKVELVTEDCIIETDLEMLIPDNYVNNISERLNIYARLDNIGDEEELQFLINELKDRFGTIPNQVLTLTETVRLRWIAEKLGFEKLTLKNQVLKAYFINPEKEDYFKSSVFGNILKYVQQNSQNCRIREKNNRPMMIISKIDSVELAKQELFRMLEN